MQLKLSFNSNHPDEAATLINVLRRRAALPGKEADMLISESTITTGGIDFILEERARELCGEYIRWFDIKRTKYGNNGQDFVNFIQTRNPDITEAEPYHRLRPIRQEELNSLLNGTEFGNNPGY